MRVLLIDDEQFYFKLIRKTLKEAEYDLEYAKTGPEGLSKIPTFEPDMMIVDLKLPEMDGFQILERLRRDPKFSHIPVIVITAQDVLSEKLKAFELGADDYLVKPRGLPQPRERLQSQLQHRADVRRPRLAALRPHRTHGKRQRDFARDARDQSAAHP